MTGKHTPFAAKPIYEEISKTWDTHIVPILTDYIKIPNKSPLFDKQWKEHGFMDKAMKLMADWCQQQSIKNLSLEVVQLPGRTPLLFMEIPGEIDDTVLLYGHMDKQPEMKGWDSDLGPWNPVLKGDKLYGRGSADDGYAVFSALTAIAVLQKHRIPHARCVVLIEACEESGSTDLPYYLDHLKERIASPNFIVCLDSSCGNYEQLWSTSSLRGLAGGILRIEVLSEGIHSGDGSGVVPSPLMILRRLLDRIENSQTGEILLKELYVDIPKERLSQARETAQALGQNFLHAHPFLEGVKPVSTDISELLLKQTWYPQLSITGLDGLPATENAGNVTVPNVAVTLSMRLPPPCDPKVAQKIIKNTLEKDPPFGAKVSFSPHDSGPGWDAPQISDWLKTAGNEASEQLFGKPMALIGGGGSIPFMGMLGRMFPKAQFLITGVLGPKSNAHGPNEFLHLPTAKKVTGCVAFVLAAHYEEFRK